MLLLMILVKWSNVRDKPVEAIDEVAVSAVTKDIDSDEAEEKGDKGVQSPTYWGPSPGGSIPHLLGP